MAPEPKDMSGSELLRESAAISERILELTGSIKEFSRWDKFVMAVNTAVATAGVVLAPPTGGASLVLTVISGVLLATEAAKKIKDVHGNAEIRAEVADLDARNQELLAEIRRRIV